MRILVASDFHDSMMALDKLLEIEKDNQINKIILLGDIFGAHSYEMVEKLNKIAYKLTIVKGNNDGFADDLPNKDFKVFDKTYENINGKIAYLCHGHRLSYDLSEYGAKIVMIGHLHVPILRRENGVVLLCPGSLAQPRGNSGKTYAIIDEEKISIIADATGEPILEMKLSEIN